MAVVFADSFQHYNNTAAKYTTAGGSFNTVAGNLRHGPQNLEVAAASTPTISFTNLGNSGRPIPNGLVNVAWKAGHLSGRIFTLLSGVVEEFWVLLHGDGSLSVETTLGTLGTSAAGIITLNAWYYISIKTLIDTTVGTVVLQVTNDATNIMTEVLNLSNVDTDPAATTFFDGVALGGPTSASSFAQDFVIQRITGSGINDDFLGAAYVNAFAPTADGDTIEGTPNPWTPGLPHFSLVNEIPPNDGATQIQIQEDVSGAAVAECYHYNFAALPALPIACVQSVADSNDVVAPSPPTINGVGAAVALISDPSTFALRQPPRNILIADGVFFMDIQPMDTNPLTGSAWTAADLLDIQIGSQFADVV
jgi:hypothetical protein